MGIVREFEVNLCVRFTLESPEGSLAHTTPEEVLAVGAGDALAMTVEAVIGEANDASVIAGLPLMEDVAVVVTGAGVCTVEPQEEPREDPLEEPLIPNGTVVKVAADAYCLSGNPDGSVYFGGEVYGVVAGVAGVDPNPRTDAPLPDHMQAELDEAPLPSYYVRSGGMTQIVAHECLEVIEETGEEATL